MDFETYYDSASYALNKMTPAEYFFDPHFETIMVAVKANNGSKERTLTVTDVIDLKALKELATTAQIAAQMFALNREGLIVFGKDELEFPQPDHPEVRAWQDSRAGVTEDLYCRGWLFYCATHVGRFLSEKGDKVGAQRVADFTASIPRMTADELEGNLARYGRDEGWTMLQAMTTRVDDEKPVH
jgi:hypothetical protein